MLRFAVSMASLLQFLDHLGGEAGTNQRFLQLGLERRNRFLSHGHRKSPRDADGRERANKFSAIHQMLSFPGTMPKPSFGSGTSFVSSKVLAVNALFHPLKNSDFSLERISVIFTWRPE